MSLHVAQTKAVSPAAVKVDVSGVGAASVDCVGLRRIKLGTVRESIPDSCYRRSTAKALGWFAFDLALYIAALSLVFAARHPVAQLLGGVLAGGAVAVMFVWAHDAAHGALFRSKLVSEVLGTLLMLPSMNMYRLWSYGHNKVHHGFTSFSPIDWIWRPLTPGEYESKSSWARFVYRRERSVLTCGLHYLLRVWWTGMVRFKPRYKRHRLGFTLSKLGTLVFASSLSYAAWTTAGGLVGVIAAVIVPFLVFTYVIAFFVYIHHTHPAVPFFDVRDEWCATIGQVFCSTVVRCSRVTELLTHRILVHVPHHVDVRVPFYQLAPAYEAIKADWGPYLHEYRFSWSAIRSIFRSCQLFDFETKTWHRFGEVASDSDLLGGPGKSIVPRTTALSS